MNQVATLHPEWTTALEPESRGAEAVHGDRPSAGGYFHLLPKRTAESIGCLQSFAFRGGQSPCP